LTDVRVVIVDDQEAFRRAMAAVVDETDGFVIVGQAGSGEESLELAAQLVPDLVLMDVNLPGMDGVEASQRLTADGRPVVVLLSTYDESDIDVASSGAAGYISKSAFGSQSLVDMWRTATAQLGN
jgi:two-component system response regulator AlgR